MSIMNKLSWIKRRKLNKQIEAELLETMCTICLYLEADSRHSPILYQRYAPHFDSHFRKLKDYSYKLRGVDDHLLERCDFFE